MSNHVDTVRKLVALSLFNPETKEAAEAYKKARSLIKKYEIGQGALFSTSSAAAWSIEDGLRFADKVREVVKDEDVQKVASAGRDAVMGIVGLIKKARSK